MRVDKVPDSFVEFGDGYLSGRDTFQKIFTQSEFCDYVSRTLHSAPTPENHDACTLRRPAIT